MKNTQAGGGKRGGWFKTIYKSKYLTLKTKKTPHKLLNQ